MQIRRVILKRVRNFHHLDRSFEDSWTGRVPDALLLMGPNGSGKTSLVQALLRLRTLARQQAAGDHPVAVGDGRRVACTQSLRG